MKVMIARTFFVLTPALVVGSVFSLLHPIIGAMGFGWMVAIGISATKARPERGEYY